MEDETGEDGGKEVLDKLDCVLTRVLGSIRLDRTRLQRRDNVLDWFGGVGLGFCGEALLQSVDEGFNLCNV